jgi:hypothetical protein
MRHRFASIIAVCLIAAFPLTPGFSGIIPPAASSPADLWHYADLADVFGPAPVVLRARISSATPIKGAVTAGGATRFYVEADVTVLIRGSQGIAPKLAWIVDIAPDSRGKPPKLRKADVLLAARPVSGRPGVVQLLTRDSQLVWSPALEARVRGLIASVVAADAPPVVTGITSAFHSAGTVVGEGETQIFLATADQSPVSITVLSRPGQPKRWAFAQGEIVDEAAAPPARDTLAWYRLACFLPKTLPEPALADLTQSDADAARADYNFVVEALGPCPRARKL